MTLLGALDTFLEAASVAQKWRQLSIIEKRLERDIAKAFTTQGKLFVKRFSKLRGEFTEAISDDDWVSIWDGVAEDTDMLFIDPIERAVQLSMTTAAQDLIAQLEVDYSFELSNPLAVLYVGDHGAELVAEISDTTRDYIQTVISQGVEEGWSYDRMAMAIIERFAEFAVGRPQLHIESRAHLIAITEAGNAYEAGNEIVVRDLVEEGLKMEKAWSTIGDKHVDPHCAANEEQGWIPFDEPFSDGSMRPLSHPACRCTALYRRARG